MASSSSKNLLHTNTYIEKTDSNTLGRDLEAKTKERLSGSKLRAKRRQAMRLCLLPQAPVAADQPVAVSKELLVSQPLTSDDEEKAGQELEKKHAEKQERRHKLLLVNCNLAWHTGEKETIPTDEDLLPLSAASSQGRHKTLCDKDIAVLAQLQLREQSPLLSPPASQEPQSSADTQSSHKKMGKKDRMARVLTGSRNRFYPPEGLSSGSDTSLPSSPTSSADSSTPEPETPAGRMTPTSP